MPDTYHDRLSRFTLDANGVAIPGSETVLIDLLDDTIWHHGGGMFFHPKNGFLYLTIGNNATPDNDQIINRSLFGGVLRLDVDCRGGNISHPIPRQPLNGHTAHYFIPNDNPFVGGTNALGETNVLDEFFCLGLRSPHRMTYDPGTGRIFIGDVGDSAREEVDIIEPGEKGLNFQWPYCEGKLGTMKLPCIGISRGPVLDYPHTDGRAIIGGYVYRGKKFARDLGGKYIFGDNVFRTVWAMDETTTPVTENSSLRHAQGHRAEFRLRLHRPFVFWHGRERRNLFLPDEQHRRAHLHARARRPAAAQHIRCRNCFRKPVCLPI